MATIKLALIGFIAGFAATLVFHQGLWAALYGASILPAEMRPWPLNPIPPFGVPSVISKAFWGGLWGGALALTLSGFQRTQYWLSWIVIGALAPTLVGNFVVPLIKGLGLQPLDAKRLVVGLIVNGAWGFGTALLLRFFDNREPARA